MASIIIHAKNKKDISLLKELSEKLGLASKVIDEDTQEDLGLAAAIEENSSSDTLTLAEAQAYYQSLKNENKL